MLPYFMFTNYRIFITPPSPPPASVIQPKHTLYSCAGDMTGSTGEQLWFKIKTSYCYGLDFLQVLSTCFHPNPFPNPAHRRAFKSATLREKTAQGQDQTTSHNYRGRQNCFFCYFKLA